MNGRGTGKPFLFEGLLSSIKRGKKKAGREEARIQRNHDVNRPSRCASMASFMAWESTEAFRAGRLPPEMLARCTQVGELSFPNVGARVFLPFEFWPWMIKVLQTLAFLHCLLFGNSRTRTRTNDECPTNEPLKNQGWRVIRLPSRSEAWLARVPPPAGRV
jgi:hypothetical protein